MTRGVLWAGALVLLFMPVDARPLGRMAKCFHDLLHVPLFALLAWTLLTRGLSRMRVLGVLGLVIVLVELFQPRMGREAEVQDVLYGAAGAVLMVVFSAAVTADNPRRRGLWRGTGIALLAAVVAPLFLAGLDRCEARRAFPLLSSFRSPLEIGRWSGQGCGLKRVRRDHQWAMRLEVDSSTYPGAFLVDAPRNWSRMEALRITLYWPGTGPKEFWIRADDRSDAPPYADRVQEAFQLQPGTNRLNVPRSIFEKTPGNRPFDLSHVVTLGLFFREAQPGDCLDILEVRLLLQDDGAGKASQ